MSRGTIPDKWSLRFLWACVVGTGASLYMVAADRQMKNRKKTIAQGLASMESSGRSSEDV